MLEIKNLTKKYNSKIVLDHIDLKVDNGEIALLLGASGVGKSTLLRILNNLETYEAGEIYLDNKNLDINNINQTHLVGMVFQQFNLFEHMSVLNNITFVLEKGLNKTPKESKEIALDLLKKFGLEEKANISVKRLSGGQKQRLAIARTLSVKPKVICLDEPTSALDPLLTSFVAKNIQELANQGYIVLVASHDVSILDKLDCTIYLMDKGQIIESAKSKEFIQVPEKFKLIQNFVDGNN